MDAISRKQLVSLAGGFLGGYPNPDGDSPPGPWDPYIRRALQRVQVFGPVPDPWRAVALNPQPLPPRSALAVAIAEEVVDRAQSMQEIADAIGQAGQQQGIIIVGGLVS